MKCELVQAKCIPMSKVVDKVVEVDETVVVVDDDEGKSKTLAGLSSTKSLLIS